MIARCAAALGLTFVMTLPLALSGCDRKAETAATPVSEVLPGSISDAMLPEDRVTSQPPLDPRAAATAKAGSGEPEDDATAAADAQATAPAAVPTPETPRAADTGAAQ